MGSNNHVGEPGQGTPPAAPSPCTRCSALEKALDQAIIDSRSAEEAKLHFLSALQHEIMTPLNCVLGASQLLRIREEASPAPADEEISELISIIEDSGQMLSAALGNILNFSTISQRDISLDLRPVNVQDLVEECLECCRKDVEAKDLIVTYQITRRLNLLLDGDRMRQVLVNLLKNACKFNRQGGDVDVKAGVSRMNLQISVWDSGVGMANTVSEQISETNFFYQGDSSRTKRFGGIGLGLAITCKLVKAMGGSLDIESKEGQGSLVTFRVPVNPKVGVRRIKQKYNVSGSCANSDSSESAIVEAANENSAETTSVSGESTHESSSDQGAEDDLEIQDLQSLQALQELQKPIPNIKNVVCLVEIDHKRLFSQVRNILELNDAVVVTQDSPDLQLADVMVTTSKQALRRRSGQHPLLPTVYLARPSEREMRNLLPIDCSQVDMAPLKASNLIQSISDRFVSPSKRSSGECKGLSRRSSRETTSARGRSIGSMSHRSSRRNSIDNSQLLPDMMRSSFYKPSTARDNQPRIPSSADFLAHRRTPSKARASSGTTPVNHSNDHIWDQNIMNKPPIHILVAEDNDINIKICSKILEHVCGEQTNIDVVRDGRQALEALKRNQSYDLVLMDVHMPEMDGIEATKELRRQAIRCPIVALSADSTVQDECLRAGMRAFLRKPLKVRDIEDLLAMLKIDI